MLKEEYLSVINKGLDIGLLQDIATLVESSDGITEKMVIILTKQFLSGYNLVNDGVALLVAGALKGVWERHGELSSDIIADAMFERIGNNVYPVGVNTFLNRLGK